MQKHPLFHLYHEVATRGSRPKPFYMFTCHIKVQSQKWVKFNHQSVVISCEKCGEPVCQGLPLRLSPPPRCHIFCRKMTRQHHVSFCTCPSGLVGSYHAETKASLSLAFSLSLYHFLLRLLSFHFSMTIFTFQAVPDRAEFVLSLRVGPAYFPPRMPSVFNAYTKRRDTPLPHYSPFFHMTDKSEKYVGH